MQEKNIGFSIELDETDLNEIEEVYNSNIEMFVTLQNEFPLTSEFLWSWTSLDHCSKIN